MMKNNKGITLIALVVTIIVLIILAGISINLVLGENGIITKAKEASKAQEIAEIKEDIQLEIMAKQASNNGDLKESDLESLLKLKGTLTSEENIFERTLTTEGGHEIKVSEIYKGKLIKEEPIIFTEYTRGQEVTIGTETFYVLEDSGETEETVILFAKYNLNIGGTAQVSNANYANTACAFSTSNYWLGENVNVTPKVNLNKYDAVIADTGSAVYKAKKYATTLLGENAEGRLLTYEEATALKTAINTDSTGKIVEMLCGQANKQSDGNYLHYWLASVYNINANRVFSISGRSGAVDSDDFNDSVYFGVRPVIEVSKLEI